MNNELPKTKIDEKTGIEYQLEGDYYTPNLTMPKQEKITLNKYGRMRLNYLKEHQKADYSIMLLDGTLNTHLKEIQEQATLMVEQIIKQLKTSSDLTEEMKNTDMLYWVGTMNAIKNQAEEIVLNELIYV
ncbi:MAG: TnpV protein [Clostridia bacterium]|nr:TnpV protein [Clostridia bacterium]